MRSRPGFVIALTLSLFSTLLITTSPAAAAPPPADTHFQIDDAGTPIEAVNIRGGNTGALPDGRQVVYAPTFGEPAKLSVVDGTTGDLISAHDLGDKTTAIYTGSAPDGTTYVAGQTPGANLFRYDPAADKVIDLGAPVPGETNISRLNAFGPDGTLYSGTFPNGHVFSYHPDRGFTDFGPIAEGEQYARATAFDGDKTLYVGSATNARFFSLDVQTREKKEIALPDGYAGTQTYVNEMHYRDGLVFAFVTPAFAWLVYDTATGQWREPVTDVQAVPITEAVDGNVYYVGNSVPDLFRYRLSDGQITRVTAQGQIGLNQARSMGVLRLTDPAWPGATIVGMGLTGRMFHYNLDTGQFRWVWTEAASGALKISALGMGPDRQLYASGYLTPSKMGRIDPDSLQTTQLSGPSQAEFVGTVAVDGTENLYVGSYIDAGIWRHDQTQEWQWGTNPSRIARLDGYDQERVLTIANASTNLAVGTLADKGNPNGRLSIIDPRTRQVTWSGSPVAEQSVASLLFQRVGPRAVMIGGTTSHQLGVEPEDSDARLFIFDLLSRTVKHVMVPRPGAAGIAQIIQLPDGRIWALASDSTILELKVARIDDDHYTLDVTEVLKIFGEPRLAGNWNSPKLAVLNDQQLVGSAAGKVFTVDIATLHTTMVADGSDATPTGDGRFFFANLTKVYRATPDAVAPETTARVTGTNFSQIGLTATDAGSGVGTIEYRWDSDPWTRYDGQLLAKRSDRQQLSYRATDRAGNVEQQRCLALRPGDGSVDLEVTPADATCPG